MRSQDDAIDPVSAAEIEAGRVFASIHPQLLACYARRLATNPSAHAYVTFDVVVDEDGHPRDVATTGGALLGDQILRCMTGHIQRAAFRPPAMSGTSHVRVPFAFEAEGSP